MTVYKVAVVPGDGTGPEVLREGVKVLEKTAELDGGFRFEFKHYPWGCKYYLKPPRMWRLFQKEYCEISKLMASPDKPCTFVLGGARISDAFMMLQTVLSGGTADNVLTGGLVANILLAVKG